MNTKAQARGMEIILITIFLVLIIMIGLAFFSQLQQETSSVRSGADEDRRSRTVATAALSLPEIQCRSIGVEDASCADLQRIEKLRDMIQTNNDVENYYFNVFGATSIMVREYFPGNQTVVLYNQTNPNASRVFPVYVPITVYEPINQTKSFGELVVKRSP